MLVNVRESRGGSWGACGQLQPPSDETARPPGTKVQRERTDGPFRPHGECSPGCRLPHPPLRVPALDSPSMRICLPSASSPGQSLPARSLSIIATLLFDPRVLSAAGKRASAKHWNIQRLKVVFAHDVVARIDRRMLFRSRPIGRRDVLAQPHRSKRNRHRDGHGFDAGTWRRRSFNRA